MKGLFLNKAEIPLVKKEDYKQSKFSRRWIKMFQAPAFSLFVFFTAFYYFTNAGWYGTGDGFFMTTVAKQIAEKGQLGFEPRQLPDDIEPFKDIISIGPNGQYYFKWGLGQSLVEAPFYFIHRLIWKPSSTGKIAMNYNDPSFFQELMIIFLCPSVISALGCMLIFLFGIRLGFSKQISIILCLIYGVGTMVWPYSKSLMSEATLNVWLVISGACLGFAFLTKITSIVTIPVFVAYILLTIRSRKTIYDFLIFFAPPVLVSIGILFWYNMIRYGNPWLFGYGQGLDSLGFITPLYVGLWGLIASPGKSYFLYTPISVLGLTSAWCFFRKKRSEALMFLGVILTVTVLHARWWSWAGDWAWGPRFLLIITPYLILPAGFFFQKWVRNSNIKKGLVISLLVFSFSIQVLGVAVHPFSFIESRTEVVDQLVDRESLSYLSMYNENAFVNFSPIFSHIIGNWWLFKHMLFSYDIWSDVPWRVLGSFESKTPSWMYGQRPIPFWWPVALPLISSSVRPWIYFLGAANLLMLIWWGLRVKRLFILDNKTSSS
jgi:hypothetical protein